MACLPLIIAPDVRLNLCSEEITIFDASLEKFIIDMIDTTIFEEGSGLAAVQVGVHKRIIVVDINCNDKEADAHYIPMINPKIIEFSSEKVGFKEACLSFPEIREQVIRSSIVTVEYQDSKGKKHIIKADNIFAILLQHEIDHINGITVTSHLSSVKKDMILRKLRKRAK